MLRAGTRSSAKRYAASLGLLHGLMLTRFNSPASLYMYLTAFHTLSCPKKGPESKKRAPLVQHWCG